MKKTVIIRIIVMLFGACLFFNGLLLMIFTNAHIGVYLTALLGLIIMLPAVFKDITKKIMSRHISKFILAFLTFFAVVLVLGSSILFIYGNMKTVTYREDYLLVLGCGVDGDVPSAQLMSRLDTALEYRQKNPDCEIIVSGGQGKGEDTSEAEVMRRYLIEHGVDDEQIIKEDKSTSTSENFILSNRVVDGGLGAYSVAFVTNDYHIYRADALARYQGFYMNYIGAKTPWYDVVPSYLRELPAVVKMFVFNK